MNHKIGSEKYAVQNRIIQYVRESHAEFADSRGRKILVKLGWEYVNTEEAVQLREGETGFLFRDIFTDQLHKLNPKFMNPSLARELVKSIERIPSTIEGNLTTWKYLKGLQTLFIPDEKRERNVHLIDPENIDNNTFHVTDEFTFTNGTKTIRPDIVFLINGLPVFLVETKASHKLEGMVEALEQVKRYHRDCPELLAILQVFAITHILKYYYSATWNTSSKLIFNWKDELEGDFETMVKTFFDRERVVKIITDYILFTRQDDELKKVVLRPHQMSAVHELIERAASKEKNRGLIWHTQGSGKTYTMIVTAQKIIENPFFKNPTVIMLVDRNELESQLFANLSALGIEEVEITESKAHLRTLLSEDKRGLIVSMIHKFDEMPASINTRENIFVLVDEAHRTTGGKLGNYLMGALPNATYMGFTGTPIDKTAYGKGTFIVFGKDDPPLGYLHKYSISESIEDGTTVPLHYCLAPNKMLVDKETLDKEFLDLKEAEGLSDVEELNKVLEKAVNLRNMLKDEDRVEEITKYVVRHFKENVEPLGYKAFLVGVDREACARYKKELDKHLAPEYSAVVYSAAYNDPEELAKYHLSKLEEKKVRKAFRKADSLPKILIVTEKLLTGFDAPVLYCMYLDKPMRDHVLLQAIARVNRPYEDENEQKKAGGLIVDFVGIFGNLEKA
ncbi:MAG: type I restriction endonuclease subunit R, partial [Candidatus Aminicenantales bacterium]